MNCYTCGAWSMVKATRGAKRRRECANGHMFNTFELHEHDAKAIRKRIENLGRGTAAANGPRKTPDHVLVRMRGMLAAGASYKDITAELGVSSKTISRWRDTPLEAANDERANRAASA